MSLWIALLRGVNVGGNNILPMKELRLCLEQLGFANVRTYIQSGNCVFEAEDSDPLAMSSQISEAIQAQFGFQPKIMVLSKAAFGEAIKNNPYSKEGLKSVHMFFLSERAVNADLPALSQIKQPSEAFELTDGVFYLFAPQGIGRSKLAQQMEKKLGVRATARNLRTVLKIAEMAE